LKKEFKNFSLSLFLKNEQIIINNWNCFVPVGLQWQNKSIL